MSLSARRLVTALASVQLALILLAILGVAIAAATFLEGSFGTAGARALVYDARWFEVLLILLGLNLVAALGRWFPYRPHQTGFILVHVAMIVILVGAGVTRYFGEEGTMHIREGGQADTMLSRTDHVQLAVGDEVASFPVRLFRAGSQSLSRQLTVGGRAYRVSVTEYWPHYEALQGHGAGVENSLQLTVTSEGSSAVSLDHGRQKRVGDVILAYGESTLLSTVGDPPLGSLEVRAGGEVGSIAVTEDVPVALEVGGVTFTITEFRADYTVGAPAAKPVRMSNPMIRVNVRMPGGGEEERMLFAYHPEFAAQHGRPDGALATMGTDYRFERRLLFSDSGDSLHACSSLPLVKLDADGAPGGQRVIPPGHRFLVTPLAVYRTPGNDFSVVLRGRGEGAMAGGSGGGPDAPPAVRAVVVAAASGESAQAVLMRGMGAAVLDVGGESLRLTFGPIRIALPYALHLDDFVLITYPGGDRPAGYESHVRLMDPERNIDGRPAVIRMNSPLTHRGRKHFQNSYDTDNRGTILIVNHDPGKWPTYVGYTLITLGFLFSLLKGLVGGRARGTGKRAGGLA